MKFGIRVRPITKLDGMQGGSGRFFGARVINDDKWSSVTQKSLTFCKNHSPLLVEYFPGYFHMYIVGGIKIFSQGFPKAILRLSAADGVSPQE